MVVVDLYHAMQHATDVATPYSQAAKAVFWPNPASALKVFFLMDYNSSGVL